MKTPLVACLLTVASASACTVSGDGEEILEEGEVTLANPDDQGKSDTVFGKTLRYNIRGELRWTPGEESIVTDTEVVIQTGTMMRVRSPRVAIGMPANGEVLDLSVDAEANYDLGEISTDMAFILWTADAQRSYWRPTICGQNYFERVVIDPLNEQIDVIARTVDGDVSHTYSYLQCGIPPAVSQVALFAFPSSGWWSLEGYYHLKIEADCGDEVCPAPQPIRIF